MYLSNYGSLDRSKLYSSNKDKQKINISKTTITFIEFKPLKVFMPKTLDYH